MRVIGIVGRMAAGKSTVARRLAERGAVVLDADALAHEVLDEPEVRGAVVARFGPDVLGADGRVRRAALARHVFGPTLAQAAALADLEAIVHPRVRARLDARLAELRAAEAADGRPRVAVLDVPLLVQAGWAAACDLVVVVECPDAVRHERLAARGIGPAERRAREAAWNRGWNPAALEPGKTLPVDAAGDLAYTEDQVDRIWERIRDERP
jgi:dephospho-CoA kinase